MISTYPVTLPRELWRWLVRLKCQGSFASSITLGQILMINPDLNDKSWLNPDFHDKLQFKASFDASIPSVRGSIPIF